MRRSIDGSTASADLAFKLDSVAEITSAVRATHAGSEMALGVLILRVTCAMNVLVFPALFSLYAVSVQGQKDVQI